MFVKLENYFGGEDDVILNTDNIVSIEWGSTKIDGTKIYTIELVNGENFEITDKYYNQLCEILTKRL